MWNIFKNTNFKSAILNQENIIADLPKIASKIYPKEVMEIHHEFETASDKLLEQAYSIINAQPIVNESKLERLQKFGFKQVKEVKEGSEIIKTTSLSKEQIELVKYYKQEYPFNKFITEEQVKEICHKYNLVCGDVSRFTGFVPDNNLKDIENFKLKEKDSGLICAKSNGEIFILNDAEVRFQGRYAHIFKKGETDKYRYAFQSDNDSFGRKIGVNFYASDEKNVFGMRNVGSINFSIDNSQFKICAPVKDMDISGLELVEGYKLQKKHIPDPVVLQTVKGGYLIVTAWGDEASDPLVVNENFN